MTDSDAINLMTLWRHNDADITQ